MNWNFRNALQGIMTSTSEANVYHSLSSPNQKTEIKYFSTETLNEKIISAEQRHNYTKGNLKEIECLNIYPRMN